MSGCKGGRYYPRCNTHPGSFGRRHGAESGCQSIAGSISDTLKKITPPEENPGNFPSQSGGDTNVKITCLTPDGERIEKIVENPFRE